MVCAQCDGVVTVIHVGYADALGVMSKECVGALDQIGRTCKGCVGAPECGGSPGG